MKKIIDADTLRAFLDTNTASNPKKAIFAMGFALRILDENQRLARVANPNHRVFDPYTPYYDAPRPTAASILRFASRLREEEGAAPYLDIFESFFAEDEYEADRESCLFLFVARAGGNPFTLFGIFAGAFA